MKPVKYLTFSYDDGVTQDKRLVDIFNKYGVFCTFNLNSALLGKSGSLEREGKTVTHNKISPQEVKSVYRGHEVAVHTLTHPNLTLLPEEEIIRQVEEDRIALSALCGYEVHGMAYPCGGVNNDARVAQIIQKSTGVRFSRTITSTGNFRLPENPYRLDPTAHHLKDKEELLRLAARFLAYEGTEPLLFYIWGHSYEFDIDDSWAWFEEFVRSLSGREDVFYGTNSEVLGRLGVL